MRGIKIAVFAALAVVFVLIISWRIVYMPHIINKINDMENRLHDMEKKLDYIGKKMAIENDLAMENKQYAMELFQKEIDKHSLEPSYMGIGTMHIVYYEDQQYVKDILERCEPTFETGKEWITSDLSILLGEYSIGSPGDKQRYFYLPANPPSSGHEFILSEEDTKLLWEFLYSIENRQ